jgi:N-methylhydantoinase A/oxoprolinase/acetone carboxylase beta subunit
VWDGRRLAVGTTLAGPVIVELANTTIVVPRHFSLRVDAYGGFALHSSERGATTAPRLEGVGLP